MAKFKLKFVLSGIDFGEDKFKLKFVACPSIAPRTIPPSAQLMDDLDGEARWSRAIQETFNRLDKAVGSLLDGRGGWKSLVWLSTSLLPHREPAPGAVVFSMGKQYGQEPHRRIPSRRLEVCWTALDRRAGWLSTVVLPHREPAPGAVVNR